jgi:PAS domain-containing protein
MFLFLRKLIGRRFKGATAGWTAPPAAAGGPGRAGTDLRPGEEQFAKLLAGVRDYAVFILDRHGNVITWNAGAEQIKGYRAEQIIGQHFSRFYPNDALSSGWPARELAVAGETGRFEDEG